MLIIENFISSYLILKFSGWGCKLQNVSINLKLEFGVYLRIQFALKQFLNYINTNLTPKGEANYQRIIKQQGNILKVIIRSYGSGLTPSRIRPQEKKLDLDPTPQKKNWTRCRPAKFTYLHLLKNQRILNIFTVTWLYSERCEIDH